MEKINNICKLGVISDSHIPEKISALPSSIFNIFDGVNLIIHCGDITDPCILDKLSFVAPVLAVKGNMDSSNTSLPSEKSIILNNSLKLYATHGTGPPFNLHEKIYNLYADKKPDIILFGHSHIPHNNKKKKTLVFNPGSCTSGIKYNSVGVINFDNTEITGKIIKI